ncbi:ExbD/TolR family protein [Bdellovibrio bacteriovorus]|uniref:TolR protein n=2 Tax=Bdellovibrio bacteriovorus TaxID=959 RepID=Q6MPL3_BDEBA|nr:biopolymer transporter ExbD [Bdellovibrio bacteriovorus]AHZ86893.1 tolR protein [Bdellovibrio bacteriovorus]ASD64657.1 tolR protein [Bdellovibrio bacteriovorus]BEV67334.1 Tol-Pal system protein TolR [Bdellovibrio bacteriovorus]CAE78784.1 tolR protein [Bdellovibrio bacteriovorus HD100]
MAHIDSGDSSGRKKNIELNLVPFIDLMSVLITFLLITAVWTQVSMIQIGSSLYGKKSDTQPNPTPPPNADVVLKVDVKEMGYVLTVGKQVISLPMVNEQFDEAGLVAQLQRVKQLYPEKVDAIVSVADVIPYEQLIKAMDNCLTAGFSAISVATGGPQ